MVSLEGLFKVLLNGFALAAVAALVANDR